MLNAIIGTKLEQKQAFNSDGARIPVTHIKTGPLHVVAVRSSKIDGYNAVILGLGNKKIASITKPMQTQFAKAGLDKNPPRFLVETKIDTDIKQISTDTNISDNPSTISENLPKVGQEIKVGDVFKEGDVVQVTGVSKGKGFAGVVKRHHFKGGPRTHGQSDRERAPGSIGQTTTPGRVYKGKRMAGRMGGGRVTLKNLKVVNIDSDKNVLIISGLVPGGRNSLLMIKKIKE